MNYFQVADKINQLHKLDIAERALLNQITSYYFNNKPFFATNEYLAEYWGVSERTITRYISKLTKLGYITIELVKKKHDAGSGFWYNKRYIVPLIDSIIDVKEEPIENAADVHIALTPEITTEVDAEDILTLENEQDHPEISTLENEDEPFLGEFLEQHNEYTRMMEEVTKVQPVKATDYRHDAVLEMIETNSDLKMLMEKAKAKGIPIDEKYTEGTFYYVIKTKADFLEKYRAITSKLVETEA